ncbi:hypothetical protein [Bacillus kwashiorkori]|uniref:hypothetical protein n=1 Tax=Bacillus kwashiorkori TaxID=1522318 RepID=UPI0007819891|nr:hypothetical protein [Bacillus kwashiorkori]
MHDFIIVSVTIMVVAIIFFLFIRVKKKKQSTNGYTEVSATEEMKKTYKLCERCKKKNYIDKKRLSYICSSCGWNLSQPYILSTFSLEVEKSPDTKDFIENLQANDSLFIWSTNENKENLVVFNEQYEIITVIPEKLTKELLPKIELSANVFAKLKKKMDHGDHYRLEIFITNDAQKKYSFVR